MRLFVTPELAEVLVDPPADLLPLRAALLRELGTTNTTPLHLPPLPLVGR